MQTKLSKLSLALCLGMTAASAQAVSYEVWKFQDDSIDFILREKAGGGYDIVKSGTAQVGDIFVGVFEMPTASATPPGKSLIRPGKELTGVSVIQLKNQTIIDPVIVNGTVVFPGAFSWTFGPYSGGMDAILSFAGLSTTVVGGNAGGGAVAAMWLNNATNSDPSITDRNLVLDAANATYGATTNCTSFADCVKEASLGSLFQVDGFWGEDMDDRNDPDNFWTAGALTPVPPTYDVVLAAAETTNFANFNAGLSTLFNIKEPVGFQTIVGGDPCTGGYVADGCVQMRVSGNILGGKGLVNGAVARDDIDARKLVAVPEPATLGLLGLGLLGLGLLRRRQG